MNTSSVIAMLQDKLPKNHAQLKTLEDKLNSLDETKINDLVSKIQQLNLKSPTIVFWVGSFVFGALDINRFMTGQIWLGALKQAIFLAHAVLFIVITNTTFDAASNVINEYLQNAFRLIGVNSFIVGIFGVVATI